MRQITVLLVGAFFYIGISPWSHTILAASSDIDIKVCYPPPAPTLSPEHDGLVTTESSILLNGTAVADSVVYVFRNDMQIGFITAATDESFSVSASLVKGNNQLRVGSKNPCQETAYSDSIIVVRKGEPTTNTPGGGVPSPGLIPDHIGGPLFPLQPEIINNDNKPQPDTPASPQDLQKPFFVSPKNGAVVSDPDIVVSGLAGSNTDVKILVNDKLVAQVLSDENGRFTAKITLRPGQNDIVALVTVNGQNIRSDPLLVTYEERRVVTIFGFSVPFLSFILGMTSLSLLIIFLGWRQLSIHNIRAGLKS